jgi:hypothetical protein
MKNDNRPAPTNTQNAPAGPRPRFLDTQEPRRVPLSQVRTDEEARLAAEIEKLRG